MNEEWVNRQLEERRRQLALEAEELARREAAEAAERARREAAEAERRRAAEAERRAREQREAAERERRDRLDRQYFDWRSRLNSCIARLAASYRAFRDEDAKGALEGIWKLGVEGREIQQRAEEDRRSQRYTTYY